MLYIFPIIFFGIFSIIIKIAWECIGYTMILFFFSVCYFCLVLLYLCKVMKYDNLLDIYPYVNIALQMFLYVPALNTSAERSFLLLKGLNNISDLQ